MDIALAITQSENGACHPFAKQNLHKVIAVPLQTNPMGQSHSNPRTFRMKAITLILVFSV
jgi:hypothetical protein